MQLPRILCQSTILSIMKEQLHLAFRKQNSQKIRYQDPRLDADRIDIICIIITLLEQDALVVTIDEASFNHTLSKHSQWQLKPQAIKQLNVVHFEPQTGLWRPRDLFLPVKCQLGHEGEELLHAGAGMDERDHPQEVGGEGCHAALP